MAGAMAVAGWAHAGLISVGVPGYTQDCSGPQHAFSTGPGFSNCAVNDSPVLIKLTPNGSVEEIADTLLTDALDGSEFSTSKQGQTLSWFYTPGAGDPSVRFYLGKHGNGAVTFPLVLNFRVDDAHEAAFCGQGNELSTACLSGALTLTSGSLSAKSLSHVTFFGAAGAAAVPEPGTLTLLGMGLLGLAWGRRKRPA